MRICVSVSRSVGSGWEDMILPCVQDPRNCLGPRILRQCEWAKCWEIYGVYFHCMIRWDGNEIMYIYSGVCQIYTPITLSTFITPVSLYNFHHSLKMYLEDVIKCIWRCTWSLGSSELRDAHGGRERASLEMRLETERLSALRDALGGGDWARLEMHLGAEIEWTQRCTWKP